jgi:AraC-like DNA-binding protein
MNSFLFFIVTNGSGMLFYDEQEYTLHSGDCVFIDCRKSYSQRSSQDDLWSLKWVHFYGFNMNGIYEKYIERGGQPVFTPKNNLPFSKLLTDLLMLAGSEDYIRDMKINEKITSLLTLIMAESWHPENNTRIGLKKQSLHHVKAYLEEHYKERITLDFLAEHFYINKFYLTRTFKEQFGITVLSYLEQVRITHAKQLLRFSDLSIEAIGREVGIDDSAYFNRVFKKVEGAAPGEYRRMW